MKNIINRKDTDSIYDSIKLLLDNNDLDCFHRAVSIRKLMEKIYNILAVNMLQSFDDLYGTMKYCNSYLEIETSIDHNLHSIRKIANENINKNLNSFSLTVFYSSLYHLYNFVQTLTKIENVYLIDFFSTIDVIDMNKDLFNSTNYLKEITIKVISSELISGKNPYTIIKAVKTSNKKIQYTIRFDNIIIDNNIFCDYIYGNKIGHLNSLLWNDCKLKIFNLKKDTKNDFYLHSTEKTTVVLEPDFLVDTTSISGCFQQNYANHYIAVLSYLKDILANKSLVLGNFVNDMLDEIFCSHSINYDEIFKQCVHKNLMVSMFIGSKTLMEIYHTIKNEHFPNLLEVEKKFSKLKVTLEPTFVSPKYGLLGRLDGLIEGETDNPNRRSIFELKSSKIPQSLAWKSHEIQVNIYDLLLESTFGSKRTGSSMIFYSKDKNNSLRTITSAPFLKKHILMVRNSIVSYLFLIANSKKEICKIITDIDTKKIPIYSRNEIVELQQNIKDLSSLERSYINSFFSFLLRELWACKTSYFVKNSSYNLSSLWNLSIDEKRINSKNITDLTFISKDKNILFFKINRSNDSLSLRKGDNVILYPQNCIKKDRVTSQIIKCIINNLNDKHISVATINKKISARFLENYTTWILTSDISENSTKKLISSLSQFFSLSKIQKNILLGIIEPRIDKNLTYCGANSYLNPIITKALASKDYFLLQGTPGSGKTSSFLMKCVEYLFQNTNENICILSFTNRAIDEVCIKLNQNNLPYLRIGKKNDPNIFTLSDISKKYQNLHKIEKDFLSKRIFCATIATYHTYKEALHNLIKFDTLFVDEASQLLEPALSGIIFNFKRFILIGDQNQLPAISIQDDSHIKCNNHSLNEISLYNYNQPLFERLFNNAKNKNWTNCYHILNKHYRMHKEISKLVNSFYGNILETSLERQTDNNFITKIKITGSKYSFLKNRIIFIDIKDNAKKLISLNEAQIIEQLLPIIKKSFTNFNSESIGIICNWRVQINLLKQKLDSPDNITIDTVERYQGSERDIIIYSTSINNINMLEHIQSMNYNNTVDRKLNVVISRAREQIIILGNYSNLIRLNQYRELIYMIKKNGFFINFNQTKEIFKIKDITDEI